MVIVLLRKYFLPFLLGSVFSPTTKDQLQNIYIKLALKL